MKLRDYLNIPYVLEARPVELNQGEWTRRLTYPELGDIFAQGQDVEQVFLEIERLRICEIVKRLKAGNPPPIPRAPLTNSDPEWLARCLGLADLIDGLLDKTATDLARN